ncbi:MAG: hypothetical protein FWF15_06525 [Oscillospiraceae bacterium]|nr:hypothetical protein [Oscillospiraceae bacterium]
MNYPSLIYAETPDNYKIDYAVFEDLKLTALISRDVLEAVSVPCSTGDILLRQEMFKTGPRQHLELLMEIITELYVLNEAFETARSNEEKYYIFVSLMKQLMEFYKNAAQCEGVGALYDRFVSSFSGELEKTQYQRIIYELDKLYPFIDLISSNVFKIHGENLKISTDKASVTLVSQLAECAKSLGLSELGSDLRISKKLCMNVVASVLNKYPEYLKAFAEFYGSYKNYYIKDILNYKSEIGFYLEFWNLADKIKRAGIPITYPVISEVKKINITNAYDITLFAKNEANIIPNDINFTVTEPFFFLTGANGGGKTTYLRTICVTVFMFINGCPVACENGEIYPMRKIFAHFPRDERFENTGRFDEEQLRVQNILDNFDADSLVLLNETYSTTTEELAVEYTDRLAQTVYHSGAFGIYITHQHGIDESDIPYLNVVVDRGDMNRRTYKVAKRRSEHGSYAVDVLKKYALTKEMLYERFKK